MANDSYRPLHLLVLAGLFGLIFVLIGWDLLSDYEEGVGLIHLLVESAVLVVSASAMTGLVAVVYLQRRRVGVLHADLDRARADSTRWRAQYQEVVSGLGAAIQDQFSRWKLSPAESEIALLLLKGLSLQEIATARGTGERTVREQARAVYRKAGLAGRSELSAFFLEDLLLPESGPPPIHEPRL